MSPWIPASQKLKNIDASPEDLENDAADVFYSIPFHRYSYLDTAVKGDGTLYGLVAETLQESIPECVKAEVGYIPNIYEYATVHKKQLAPGSQFSYQLDFNKFMRDKFESLKSNTIQLHKDKKNPFEATLMGLKDEVLLIHTAAELPDGEKVFVYGSKEEILSVNKEQIFELGMVVIRNLLTRVIDLEEAMLTNKQLENLPAEKLPVPENAPVEQIPEPVIIPVIEIPIEVSHGGQ